MPLITVAAEAWPGALGWLVPGENCTNLGATVCTRALQDVGILEVPTGSNRGMRIDQYMKRAGLPPVKDKATGEGWWWCAGWVGAIYADCGLQVPKDYTSCDSWLPYIGDQPTPGSVVLYGIRGDAHHIGIVVRCPDPERGQTIMLSVEGNRGFAGTTNNGVAVDIGPVIRKDILGYANPEKFMKKK